MDVRIERDRLRELIETIVTSLDEEIDGEGIAARGCLSRYHFDRLVGAAIGEAPGAFRRRLLLERAGWELRASRATITWIALHAGYRSAEGFTRAFARAFGVTPARFRRAGTGFRLTAPNGVHFHPPGGIHIPGPDVRSNTMDFVDRVIEHDVWFTNRLLERAAALTPDDLDRTVLRGWSWRPPAGAGTTLRALLSEMVANKENWSASLAGGPAPSSGGDSIAALRQRYAVAGPEFIRLVRAVRDRGEWDGGFIDALCDPPQSFTYGGMLAHVMTFSALRRSLAVVALGELGVDDVGIGDPIEWERSIA